MANVGQPKKYPPISLLQEISNRYPSAWEQMKMFHESNGALGLPSWPEWCYAPMAAAIAVATQGANLALPNGADILMSCIPDAQVIAVLAPWRLSKEVFVIDKGLETLLTQQASEDITIPSHILLQLPYPCFYVQTSLLQYMGKTLHGFFVNLEYDVNNDDKELRFLFVTDSNSFFAHPIHIDENDIETSLNHTLSEAQQSAKEIGPEASHMLMKTQTSSHLKELKTLLNSALEIVLYLCSVNAEIEENPEKAKKTKRNPSNIKDRFAEIRQWDVGVRIGNALRTALHRKTSDSNEETAASTNTHASPRTHMRRGHWHNYWTGPKSGTRKLVLKWTAPTIVGAADDGSPLVLHLMKDEGRQD